MKNPSPIFIIAALALSLGPTAPSAVRAQETILSDPASGSATAPGDATDSDTPSFTLSIPTKIAFQGFLRTSGGQPVNTPVNLVVGLYFSQSGPTSLWTETHTSVPVTQGVFQIALGANTPLNLSHFPGPQRWVGISVNGEAELPRVELMATPFAFRAAVADSLVSGTAAAGWSYNGFATYTTSRVGIGTSDPVWELEVHDVGSAIIDVQSDDLDGSATLGAGSGGFLDLRRGDGSSSADLDPGSLSVTSSSGTCRLGASPPGDASTILLADAISDPEILDEPGVAQTLDNTNIISLASGATTVILSRTITCPDSGYVLATAGTSMTFTHTNGVTSDAVYGLSDDGATFADAQDLDIQVSPNAPTGSYQIPIHASTVFKVPAGAQTISLIATQTGATIDVRDATLSLLYVPTAYGTTTEPLAQPSGPEEETAGSTGLTPADILSERAASIAANQERVEREIADLRAASESLRAELEEAKRPQMR